MSPELIGICVVGVSLASLIFPVVLRTQRDVSELRERMAKIEGLFEGFTKYRDSGSAQ